MTEQTIGLILYALDHMQHSDQSSEWEMELAGRAIEALLSDTHLLKPQPEQMKISVLSVDTERAIFEVRRAA